MSQHIINNNGTSTHLTQTESAVSRIWAEVLEKNKIMPEDNFFEQGGDSLMTMMVLFRVNDTLRVELPPDALFESPTLEEFCHVIDSRMEASKSHSLMNGVSSDPFKEDTGIS